MKKVLLLSITALLFLSACKKTIIEESSIVFTDEPPKELWAPNEIYKQTYKGFLTPKEISETENRGYHCNSWYNNNQWYTVDCGNYYLISTHDYYGMLHGKIYVSKARKMVTISGNVLLNAQDAVKRKGSVVTQTCDGCWNPVGTKTIITNIEQ